MPCPIKLFIYWVLSLQSPVSCTNYTVPDPAVSPPFHESDKHLTTTGETGDGLTSLHSTALHFSAQYQLFCIDCYSMYYITMLLAFFCSCLVAFVGSDSLRLPIMLYYCHFYCHFYRFKY